MGEHYSLCIDCGSKKGRHVHPNYTEDTLCDDCAIQQYEEQVETAQEELNEIKADIKSRKKSCMN